ncbi:MAG: hypothetical protein QNK37_15510 [Acidobacteriota bacterium]|nr:hypothetical protein [Acidobacteriota bacterium]
MRLIPEKPFLFNLLLLWLFGVLGSGWLLYYTSWFPVVGGLMGLGGLFSWFAFVSKLLDEDRTKELQELTDRVLFRSKVTSALLIVLFPGFVLMAGFLGAIEVKSVGASADRTVHFQKAEPAKKGEVDLDAGSRLAPGGVFRRLVWTNWWSPTRQVVRVAGLPRKQVTVKPFSRTTLNIPTSFLRETILLRASPALVNSLRNDPHKLVVSGAGWKYDMKDYRGETVWIGPGPGVDLPESAAKTWPAQLNLPSQRYVLRQWLDVKSLTPEPFKLAAAKKVTVELQYEYEEAGKTITGVYVSQTFLAKRVNRPGDYPQLEEIDVP